MTVDQPSRPAERVEPTAAAPPIFVVGSMRSGSTMLRLILDSHPHIAIGPETGFMGGLLAVKSIPNWRHGKGWYERIGWTESEIDAELRAFYAKLFTRHAAEQGKSRWGEKTPFHTSHMIAMSEVFPDAVFVGIVRHPGAVAASLRKSFHYTFADALSYWEATNLDMVRAAVQLGPRFVLCRYEDLVQDSDLVLHGLTTFLDEPWSPDLVQHHRVQRDKGAPRAADGSTITSDAIDASRAQSWALSATPEDQRALADMSALPGFFGYHPHDADTREDLVGPRNSGPRLPTGEDVRRRQQEWADRIDFDRQPPTLVIDARPEELAQRLEELERVLARVRSRRSVRLVDAARKVQHGRSLEDLRQAWAYWRGGGA